ncbi:MAG: GNAT family protein [Spirochaetales bacterium]|nr:GNAT family protein [Spirochaetales bacterium]
MLKTDRLVLREVERLDSSLLTTLLLDKEHGKFIPPLFSSIDEINRYHIELLKDKDQLMRTRFFFIIENIKTRESIGFVSLKVLSSEIIGGTGGFGYIISKNYKGRGYATEAAHRILDFGFRILKLDNIEASIASENAPSIRIAAKLGMTHTETVKESFTINGTSYDEMKFNIRINDFKSVY